MISKTYTGPQKMDVEDAKEYIELFSEEFGPLHLYLAKHAAFPLALTPDLLYRLWVNFQRDNLGGKYPVPWIAVADLLLSPLCKEVRYELYEMDITIRSLLLNMLKDDETLGMKRVQELSNFLLDYVYLQLNDNLNVRTSKLASAQRWTALAYTKPSRVAHELSETINALSYNRAEQIRLASLTEALNVLDKPEDFEPFIVLIHNLKNPSESDTSPHTIMDSETKIETYHATKNVNQKSTEDKGRAHQTPEIQSNIEAVIDDLARNNNRVVEIVHENKSSKESYPNHLLRIAREQHGWTQAEVAEKLGLQSTRSITRWEQGKSFPIPSYRQALCKIFNMTLPELGLVRYTVGNIDQLTVQPNTQDVYKKETSKESYPNHLLRIAREQRGWTQAEVAKKLGLQNTRSITRWEHGEVFPSAYYQRALCVIFNMSLGELGLSKKESVNLKQVTPLSALENGELFPQGNLIHFDKKDATDPAEIFDQQVSLIEQTERIVQIVTSFPPRQRHALLYSMKENIQDLPPIVVKIFSDYGLDLEKIEPIQDKVEMQRMRALLAVARKKLLHAYHAEDKSSLI